MDPRARFDDLVEHRAFELEGLTETLSTSVPDEVPGVLERVEAAVARGQFAAGFVAYEAAPGFDRSLAVVARDEESSIPLAWFAIYERRRAVDPILAPELSSDLEWVEQWSAAEHEKAVKVVHDRIREGWTYQVNLTTSYRRAFDGDPFELYRQLASAQACAYNAYLEWDGFAIASASPELFFSMADGVVTSRPMKGTAPRGRFSEEDEERARVLASSPKERAENVMIVDLVRNDLGRIATYGGVSVPELLSLERYPTVWQLTSEVRAELRPSTSLGAVFAALFPCGSVTGAPKASTMSIITELEPLARGVYCGAIGLVEPGPAGPHARFAVGIRTATIDRVAKVATYGAGGGITADSDPTAEWAEVVAKARVLTHWTDRFGLFETMRYETETGFVNLERHLDRLEASAAFFDVSFHRAAARALLASRALTLPSPARVRLTLDAGRLSVVAEALLALGEGPTRLALDRLQVDSSDALLFHKTTLRSRYEAAMARHPDADDVILQNERGELTETTRANLALELDGRWWTPARECGLLAGVERARLLEEGVLSERVLTTADLGRATRIATMSSLRGWRAAVLLG